MNEKPTWQKAVRVDHDYTGLGRMVGETIIKCSMTEDQLIFDTYEGERIIYETEGDCCSETWIEHLTVPDLRDGAQVVAVSESETVEDPNDEHDDLVQVYHIAFVTMVGEVIVEFRNGSNGYYGGSLRLVQ